MFYLGVSALESYILFEVVDIFTCLNVCLLLLGEVSLSPATKYENRNKSHIKHLKKKSKQNFISILRQNLIMNIEIFLYFFFFA